MTAPQAELVPRHVAMVMDGNGRWARARSQPRTVGHRQGVEATRRVIEACGNRGVEILTLFAFSSENWQRPKTEVTTLMELFLSTLRHEVTRLVNNEVRVRFIGDRTAFSTKLQGQIAAAERATAAGQRLHLNIAANYGGRWDITRAARALANEPGGQQITTEAIAARLTTADLREPDLFIRTGGEQRISNFLLWQLAYTELYFTEVLWPDFDDAALERAFVDYAGRQRRFGRTAEQLRAGLNA